MENSKSKDEKDYPSVKLAYEIALKSYDWAIQRLNAMDDRTDKLLVWISSITLGTVALVGGRKISDGVFDWWFVIAIAIFMSIVCFGLYIRQHGALTIIDPKKTYNLLHKSEWNFQKDTIYFAGEHLEKNIGLVNKKADYTTYMIYLFLAEIAALVAWIISLRGA
jgi:hypothetical protein